MSSLAESSAFFIENRESTPARVKPFALSIGLHILLLIGVAAYQRPGLLPSTEAIEVIYLPEGFAAAGAAAPARPVEPERPAPVELASEVEVPVTPAEVSLENRSTESLETEAAPASARSETGSGRVGVGSGSSAGQVLTLKQEYILNLRALLERNKVYPRTAQKLRQTGKVMLLIEVQSDGRITERKILEPARYSKLTEAAFALISALDRLPPIPEELRVQSWQIQVPVEYELR